MPIKLNKLEPIFVHLIGRHYEICLWAINYPDLGVPFPWG